jgi:hypothetical protein
MTLRHWPDHRTYAPACKPGGKNYVMVYNSDEITCPECLELYDAAVVVHHVKNKDGERARARDLDRMGENVGCVRLLDETDASYRVSIEKLYRGW